MTIPEIENYIQGLKDLLNIQEEVDKLDVNQMKNIVEEMRNWQIFVNTYKRIKEDDTKRNP